MLCGQGDATCAVLIDFGLARRSDVQAEDDGDGEVPPTSKVSPGASPGTLPLPYPYPYPTPTPNQVTIAFREYSDYLDPYRDPIGGRLHALQSLLLLVIFLVGVIEPYP